MGERTTSDEPELPAGDFSAWLRQMQGALRGEHDSEVPCGGCTACCTASQFILIEPDEVATLARIPRELRFPAPRRPPGYVLLGYDERGHCPMLVEGACSIYEVRPRACRTYDCRVLPAAGIDLTERDKALLAQRARRWRFSHPTERDRAEHDSVRGRRRVPGRTGRRAAGGVGPGQRHAAGGAGHRDPRDLPARRPGGRGRSGRPRRRRGAGRRGRARGHLPTRRDATALSQAPPVAECATERAWLAAERSTAEVARRGSASVTRRRCRSAWRRRCCPAGSSIQIRSPTPVIVVFSMRIRPPPATTRSAVASTSSTANVHSKPRMGRPSTSSRRCCRAAMHRARPAVVALDVEEPGRAPRLEAPAEHRLVEAAGGVDVVGVDGEVSERCTHAQRCYAGAVVADRRRCDRICRWCDSRHARRRAAGRREPAVRGYAVTHPAGRVVLPAASGWNQLLFASAGVMTVETAAGRWVVPPAPGAVDARGRPAPHRDARAGLDPHPLPRLPAARAARRLAGGQRHAPAAGADHPRRRPGAARPGPRRARAADRRPARPAGRAGPATARAAPPGRRAGAGARPSHRRSGRAVPPSTTWPGPSAPAGAPSSARSSPRPA